MNKQTGLIAAGYLYLAGAVMVILALSGLVVAGNRYAGSLDARGYVRGVAETTARFESRDNTALQAVVAAQRAAEARAAQAEEVARSAQDSARSAYAKGVSDGKTKTDALIAAARIGSLRLVDPGAGTSPVCPGPVGAAQVTASAGRDNAAAQGGLLSPASAVFLLGEAERADEIVAQLSAAQAILASDRVMCNAPTATPSAKP